MKRSTKKTLGMAVAAAMASASFYSQASAGTVTWTNTVGSQDWNTAANWTPHAVPGSSDTAFFNVAPPSNAVSVSSASNVGAIFSEITATNLAFSGSPLTLFGQTLTVPQFGETLTNENNVVLAMGDTGAAATNTLTIGNAIALENAQNVMIASANSGLGGGGHRGQPRARASVTHLWVAGTRR